jgi:site-specific DNA-cytosine methylase
MILRAADCQGFAGGFTLGAVQAGFELAAKREMSAGFGMANCEANRHLLGYGWDAESVDPVAWSVPRGPIEFVLGNPPCSGFSGMSHKNFRGIDSPINRCMWDFVEYAARVKPLIAIFESVQAAYSKGLELMRALRARLEELTGARWTLYHVKHDAHALGGPAVRRRYFWVASRVEFGVEHPTLPFAATLYDAIGDLQTLHGTWLPQPYREPATRWSASRRSETGVVDGHMWSENPFAHRLADLAEMIQWQPGRTVAQETRRCYETYGQLPDSWAGQQERLVAKNFDFGFNAVVRWPWERPARVVTGAGPNIGVHPHHSRGFTHREIARIMGFPDDWLIYPIRSASGLGMTWGKGITVDCGRWIATWARRSILGEPGSLRGVSIGDREFEIAVAKVRSANGSKPDIITTSHTVQRTGSLMTYPTFDEGAPTAPATPPPPPPSPAPAPVSEESTEPKPAAKKTAAKKTTAKKTVAKKTTPARRGRPRPDDVIKRDEQIFNALTDEGMTRPEVAAAVPDVEESLIYISLYRLRRDGRADRVHVAGRGHVWKRVG